jgi:hypothetical protein
MSGPRDPLGLDPLGPLEDDLREPFPVPLEVEPLSPVDLRTKHESGEDDEDE